MTIFQIDFHDRGPPGSNKGEGLVVVLKKAGDIRYKLVTEHVTQVDLETEMTDEQLQRYVVDSFQFIGAIYIDHELKILQEEKHHGNAPNMVNQ